MKASKLRVAKVFLLCLLTCLMLSLPSAADPPNCSICGRELIGTYYTKNGKNYCPADYERIRLHCSVCGVAIDGKYYNKDGKILCQNDYRKQLNRCSVCGQQLTGEYYKNKSGRFYCPKDYEKQLPVCTVCGKVVHQTTTALFDRQPACDSCQKKYANHCFICGLPVKHSASHFDDGRYVCAKHARNMVDDNERAQQILKAAIIDSRSLFGNKMRVSNRRIPIHLLLMPELLKKSGKIQADSSLTTSGLCSSTCRGDVWKHVIYALSGLPPNSLYTVCVHEYAHALQHERNQYLTDKTTKSNAELRFREGFAQWVAYKVNMSIDHKAEANHLLEYKDDIYGRGLREYLELEKKVGVQGVFRYALGKSPS